MEGCSGREGGGSWEGDENWESGEFGEGDESCPSTGQAESDKDRL